MVSQKDIEITNEGRLGVYYLKSIWTYYQALKHNQSTAIAVEWTYINGVFNALGIGTEPTIKYIMGHNDNFDAFEDWIETHGTISQPVIDHFNTIVSGKNNIEPQPEYDIFSPAEIAQWHTNGYIILKNAISKADCDTTTQLIYDTINAHPSQPKTWYKEHPLKQGIMIQLFNAPILDRNRLSQKIQRAYQQLWNRKDLLVSMDRVSFNPPETAFYHFPGPNLHWDVSLKQPIPFGLQGLLYLSDTDENQGAFTVVPGFQNHINNWLDQLKPHDNPRAQNALDDFPKKPIAAKAGDFIIWNQCLPHGSCPNTSNTPRIVQYINYQPLDLEYQTEWI
jgi:hypothetical protein